MYEHGGSGQADLPRLPRALMIISLDFVISSSSVQDYSTDHALERQTDGRTDRRTALS